MSSRRDVVPDVQLGPVGQREHPDVLAGRVPAVVQVPQLGALPARVPLPNASRSEKIRSLARARSSSRRAPPNTASNRLVGDGVEQRHGLQRVAGAVRPLGEPAVVDVVLHLGDRAAAGRTRRRPRSRKSSTSGKLCPVSTCSSENGTGAGPERLERQVQHQHRVLAAGEQDHRPVELAGHLAEDVDRLGLERVERVEGGAVEMRSDVGQFSGHDACSPHSVLAGRPSGRCAGRRRARLARCRARSRSTGSPPRPAGSPARRARRCRRRISSSDQAAIGLILTMPCARPRRRAACSPGSAPRPGARR